MPVGGIRISREAGTTVRTASYLPIDCAVFCRFLSSRKVSPSRQSSWARMDLSCMHGGSHEPALEIALHGSSRDFVCKAKTLKHNGVSSVAGSTLSLCPCLIGVPHSHASDTNPLQGCSHGLD